jgi:hypothetical protein
MAELKFDAELQGDGSSVSFVEIPEKVMKAFNGRKRVKVKVKLNGYLYRTTIFSMGGCCGIPVRREIRNHAKLEPGDRIRVVLEEDLDVRTVSIPSDFLTVLKRSKEKHERFKQLSYTRQKELVTWITGAKKPETRTARIKKALNELGTSKD